MSRLIELRVSNFQRIKAVAIRPDGNLVTIAGANDQGKTSLLRAVWVLLAGQAAAPARLIREGEEECKLYGDFGEIKVTRTFRRTEGGDVTMSVKVTEADGTPIKGKLQGTLDKLLGAYAFDPLAFARAKPKEQYDTLKALVPGVDFDDIANRRRKAYEARTVVNGKIDMRKGAVAAIQLPPGSCPKEIDVSAQLDEITKANAANSERALEQRRRLEKQRDIDLAKASAERTRQEAAALYERARALDAATVVSEQLAADLSADLKALPPIQDEIDITPIRAKIGEAEKVKATRALFANRSKLNDEIEALEGEANGLTAEIDALDQKKSEAIAAAKMPVAGLGFGDDEILLKGLPFTQAGTRVKILTSAMIAMALNPKLRVMTIDEGSELDQDGLRILEKLAVDNDYTVIIARVDEHGASGFVMEDGSLLPVKEAAE